MSRRASILSLIAAVAVAILILGSGCGRGNASTGTERPPASVTALDVVVRDVPYYIDEIGRCSAFESVTVMPRVAGQIDSSHFTEGTDIKKGDLLFTIDKRPFQATVAQTKAALLQSQENLKLAKTEFARVEALQGTSAISQTEYDQKKSAVAVADAQMQAAQANVDTAQLNLDYCEIKSPINGKSGQRLVDPGNIVKENETALVMVQNMDPIRADFTIPEDRLAEVRANMAKGTLQVQVTLASDAMKAFYGTATTQPVPSPASQPPASQPAGRSGKLVFLDNAVQDATGTVKLRAEVANSDRTYWPGQFVQIRLVLHEIKDAVLVPSQTVQIGQQGTYVYVVKPDDKNKDVTLAELRPVETGQKHGDLVAIKHGLNAGDRVIVTGQMMVMPGGKVKVTNAQPTAVAKGTEAKP